MRQPEELISILLNDCSIAAAEVRATTREIVRASERYLELTGAGKLGRDGRSRTDSARSPDEETKMARLLAGELRGFTVEPRQDSATQFRRTVVALWRPAETPTNYLVLLEPGSTHTALNGGADGSAAPQSAVDAEARFRFFAEAAYDWIWQMDANGHLIYQSPKVYDVLGYTPEEMLGLTALDFMDAEQVRAFEPVFRRTLDACMPFVALEIHVRHKTGALVILESTGMPVFGSDGSLVGFRGANRDVGKRRAAEQALRESEERLRESQKVASIGHYVFDIANGCWSNSDELDRVFGIDKEYARNIDGWLNIVHPEDRAEMQRYLADHVIAGRNLFDREYRILLGGRGETRWVHGRGQLHFDAAGRVVRMFGTIQDITNRKRAELALIESEHRLRLVMEATRDGLWDWNVTTNQLYYSDASSKMLGYEPGEIPSDFPSWLKLLPEEERAPALARATDCIENRCQHYAIEFRMRTKEGGWRWILGRGKAVARDANSRATRLVGTFTDISERRLLEEQLRHSQKLEAVGQLAGGVAHDFNNILSAMMMQLSLLGDAASPTPAVRERLNDIEQSIGRAAALTRQLLMFSRRSVMQVRALNLNEVVEHVLKMLRRLIGENIELRFEPERELPPIEGDVGMTEQVLMNLAVNARDAMPRGGTLTIRTYVATIAADGLETRMEGRRTGRFVCLSVADTGSGMDSTTLARIFDPFFTTKDAGYGTGLGLATVQSIVAQHRGWVEVQSALGQGSQFTVFLPISPSAAAKVAPASKVAPPIPMGGETILVVEDDAMLRGANANCLRRLGYRVIEAGNSAEALTCVRDFPGSIDLVLTDVVMPGTLSGIDLAARLRSTNPRLKVIVSSGYNSKLANMPDDLVYLEKPYSLASLGATVRNCLDGHRGPNPRPRGL